MMKYEKKKQSLLVELEGEFNLDAVRKISEVLGEQEELVIDLSRSAFVDSNAIVFIHRLMEKGTGIQLENPPEIFYEVIQILGLHQKWDLNRLVKP